MEDWERVRAEWARENARQRVQRKRFFIVLGIVFLGAGLVVLAVHSDHAEPAPKPLNVNFVDKRCMDAEGDENRSRTDFEPGQWFEYKLNGGGCYNVLRMPNGNFDWDTKYPFRPDDWFAWRCENKFIPPTPIRTLANLSCPGSNYLLQGQGTLVFKRPF